jgi:hypothetical protein
MFGQAFRNIDKVLLKVTDILEQDRADDTKTSHDGKPGVLTHGGVNERRNYVRGHRRYLAIGITGTALASIAATR